MFAKFYNLPLWPHPNPVQPPYCAEYASAVQALTTQIPSFKVSSLEEVLAPALLLLIAESWLTGQSPTHYSGLEQLVKASGESLFHQSRHDLFSEVRLTMVAHALYFGERTMFGEDWWKRAPFSSASSVKSPSDLLIDYMADMSALLEDANDTHLVTRDTLSNDLEYRARSILHQLFSWRWAWQARNADGVFEEYAGESGVFETMLCYAEPHLLYEVWLCDALLILVIGFLKQGQTQQDCAIPTRLSGKLWMPSDAPSVQELAVEICRSLRYQLQNLWAPAPVHEWTMPLALAYVTLSSDDPIKSWVYRQILAAPERRRVPWLWFIDWLLGQDRDVPSALFARWPVRRPQTVSIGS
ncbi:hypothetical protein PRZ48_005558 [Zasmidium cellare]|uniref:Uncharacterized protein n=1 Tax=Zasmidium cellare TaxID=395010 RepID=A0ABR0ELK6_ZASCE|nr:hypothetical protein PRZ48_005558 [Zasmidium cellare]